MKLIRTHGGRRCLRAAALLGGLGLEIGIASCAVAGRESDSQADDASRGTTSDANDASCESDSDACPSTVACDDFEWCPATTKQRIEVGLTSVWGSGAKDVWAVGAAGTVIHWDGNEWTVLPRVTDWVLSAVWGTGPENVWAVSSPNKLFHTTGFADGTAPWSPVTPIASDDAIVASGESLLHAIWATSPTNLWIGGDTFMVGWPDVSDSWESGWRSVAIDGGVAWAPIFQGKSQNDTPRVQAIWGSGPEDIWVVGSRGQRGRKEVSFAAHTSGAADVDGGLPVWTELSTQSIAFLYAIWGSGPGDVWAVGDYGTIRHITAGAKTWSIVDSPTTEHLRGIWGSGPRDIWAVGRHGTFLHYDGVTWKPQTGAFPDGDAPYLYSVWGSGPADVWAVGNGIIMHYSGPKASRQ